MSYDLSKLYMDFSPLKEGEGIKDKFPELNGFIEFHECTDEMIKIAICLGDIDSPFVRIKDRDMMVREVFSYLGIDMHTNVAMFERVVAYRHPKIMGAWLRYLQILHENDFTDWLLARKDYEFFIAQTEEPRPERGADMAYYKKRIEVRERVKELGQEIRRIESKLFPDSKAAREAAIIENGMKIRLFAEQYAESNTWV